MTRLTVLLAALSTAVGAQQPAPQPVAIVGITVINPGSDAAPVTNQTILIDSGLIRAVGASATVRVPPGARVVNGRGKFAIPGLWDMHVHFMNTGASALPVFVALGVTSVREMGGYIDSTRAWQARMKSGTLVGPRIVTAGPILESPRYLQGVRDRSARLDGRLAARVLPYRISVGNADDARRALDSLKTLGVDFAKIRTTASPDAYFAILREGRRVGLSVVGHPPSGVSLADASDSGQKSIEHGFFPPLSALPPDQRQALYRRFAGNHTWYTPTLVVSRTVVLSGDSAAREIFGKLASRDERRPYASKWLLEWWRMQVDERIADSTAPRALYEEAYKSSANDVRAMSTAGVQLLAGTDAGSVLVYPGFSLHEELRLLVHDGGLSPKLALRAATAAPARFFGMEETLGAIAPLHIADIVLLNANPLTDIRNTRRVFAVIQGGRVFARDDLDGVLRDARAAAAR